VTTAGLSKLSATQHQTCFTTTNIYLIRKLPQQMASAEGCIKAKLHSKSQLSQSNYSQNSRGSRNPKGKVNIKRWHSGG